ncbi:putative methyltransferase [Vigna angularis]|uniref:Putative methyltransferase n=1 Tax=Phaseolus angularis TaxID=3914 RepID=A0A8T0JHL1_PHAAN|nr:putative methyltransferase [Vigna angularis]
MQDWPCTSNKTIMFCGGLLLSFYKIQFFKVEWKCKNLHFAAKFIIQKHSRVTSFDESLLPRFEESKEIFPTFLEEEKSIGKIEEICFISGGVEKLIVMDASYDMVQACRNAYRASPNNAVQTEFLVADEEFLPIKESSVDLVVSCLGLHWTNDLPGAMIQSRLALKPDGLFLAAILGGETLKELRIACTLAQMERSCGFISPFVIHFQVRDAGNLLTRAGFTLPGVDVDEYIVKYESALELIEHLRAMGETNALSQMNNILKRDTALATAAIYDSMFSSEDGTVPATFQVIYMTGWREHPSQQKAKRRGSATISFNDIQKQFGSQS